MSSQGQQGQQGAMGFSGATGAEVNDNSNRLCENNSIYYIIKK